jgi:MFS family permease
LFVNKIIPKTQRAGVLEGHFRGAILVRFRDILQNRSFLFLWLGQVISTFGEKLNQMALIALVYKRAPGSTIELAKLLFFIVIPVFVIGPIAGVYVDRWDRKRVMVISDVLRGILVLSIPFFILFFKSFVPIYIAVFFIFSITRFFVVSRMAIIPDIVPKHMLLMANTLSDTTRIVATFIGMAVAGIMIEKIGAIKGFYINSITYLISALFLSNMVVKKIMVHFKKDILMAKHAIKTAIRKSIWSEIKDGIKFIIEHKEIMFVTKTFFILMAGVGSVSCVIIVFIQEVFGSITQDFSILFMFLGLGAFISTMSYGRFGQWLKKERVILRCMLLSGIFIVLFAVIAKSISHLWISSAIMFVLGISLGPIMVSLNTMVHELIPQETRGRIFSSLEIVINLGFLLFMFMAAFFAEHFEKVWVLIFCGILFFSWGALGHIGRKRRSVIK